MAGESMWSMRNAAICPSSSARSASVRSVLSMTASDHRRKRARSASATPNISAMTVMGMGAATASTKSTGRSAGTAVEDLGHHLADPVVQAGHRPRGELPVDQAPVGGVQGRVEVEDRPGVLPGPRRIPQRVVDQHPPSGHEAGRITADGPHVLVAADGHQTVGGAVDRGPWRRVGQHLEVVGPEEEPGSVRVMARSSAPDRSFPHPRPHPRPRRRLTRAARTRPGRDAIS